MSEEQVLPAQLIQTHYKLAYRIAYSFYSPLIGDDVKENIALRALQRAAEWYDSKRGGAFPAFLHLCITNALKTEAVRVSKQPRFFAETTSGDEGSAHNIFDNLPVKEQSADLTEYFRIWTHLENKLSPRQRTILEAYMQPDSFLEQYMKKFNLTKSPRKVTYNLLSRFFGVSGAMISFEFKKIKKITKSFLQRDIDG